ncbi:hypothetical protein H0H87_012357, partial [Tephrocybe sp. NHM501043]
FSDVRGEVSEVQREELKRLGLLDVSWVDAELPLPPTTKMMMRFPKMQSLLSVSSIHLVPYFLSLGVSDITRVDLRVGRHDSDHTLRREVRDVEQYIVVLADDIKEVDLHDDGYIQLGTLPFCYIFFLQLPHTYSLWLAPLKTTSGRPSCPFQHCVWLHGVDITLPSSQSWVAHLAHLDAPNLHKLTLDVYVDPLLVLPTPPLNTLNTLTTLNPHNQLKTFE